MIRRVCLFCFLMILNNFVWAHNNSNNIDNLIQKSLQQYYKTYQPLEYFSGISVAIAIPNTKEIKTYTIGTISHKAKSVKITPQTLFQIGSISKSFTAAIAVKQTRANRLKLSDTVGQYLKQYPKWSDIKLQSLLNMTSGLPNYSDTPTWNYKESKDISRIWSNKQLIAFAYPRKQFMPPLKQGYYYTNTGYILADMMLEKASKQKFKKLLIEKIITPLALTNTFYSIPKMSATVRKRLAHGYGYNQFENPELLGKDLVKNNLSWAAAAGGLVATPSDVIKWVQALFINDKLFSDTERQQMQQLVSQKTGKPIANVTKDDPRGFALGLVSAYDPNLGQFWFYEGETLGYRAIYMYKPCNKIIIAATLNSGTNSENDHISKLIQGLYQAILKAYPNYQC